MVAKERCSICGILWESVMNVA
ncbi:Protein of unknown function [Bacillus cytotoxicus]|uniref:Uncharacterized protein n=1 Tax=Bacillus cytotoxicus TaxID=580165 RepID=A0AAX2CNH5_9BACI|nr:Protein of unknown function [Bacillus cytotoxicus]SCN42900.1 Protein of unknown function [Bacillus cytotoxicus]